MKKEGVINNIPRASAVSPASVGRKISRLVTIAVFGVLSLLSVLICTGIGSVKLPIADVAKAIFIDDGSMARLLVWNLRFPRVLVGGLVGVCLSLSGCILQGVMRNTMASPSTIGVTGGDMSMFILEGRNAHMKMPAAAYGIIIRKLDQPIAFAESMTEPPPTERMKSTPSLRQLYSEDINCAGGSASIYRMAFHQCRNDDERWRKCYAAICLRLGRSHAPSSLSLRFQESAHHFLFRKYSSA